jgi:hypothetical protein
MGPVEANSGSNSGTTSVCWCGLPTTASTAMVCPTISSPARNRDRSRKRRRQHQVLVWLSGMDPQCKTLKKNQQTPLCFVIRVEVCCMESVEESICLDLDLQQTKSSIGSSRRRRRIAAADICLSLLDLKLSGALFFFLASANLPGMWKLRVTILPDAQLVHCHGEVQQQCNCCFSCCCIQFLIRLFVYFSPWSEAG